MDAQGQTIVSAFMQGETSLIGDISNPAGASATSRINERVEIVPIISGGTLAGVKFIYDNHSASGPGGGVAILNGVIVGTGDASGGSADNDGPMTRTFQSFTSADGKWIFDGTLNVEVHGNVWGGLSSPFLLGTITDTLDNTAYSLTATSGENGDVYIFDDVRIQVELSGDSSAQNVQCSQDNNSFILLHKQGGGPVMSCVLNADCSGCL